MKTSKIIFISLLGAVALLILAAFIDLKINGHKSNTYPADVFKVNKTNIPAFKILCLSNCGDIELISKDSSSIEMICKKDSLLPHLNYAIKGDTLYMYDTKKSNYKTTSYKVCFTNSLSCIVLKNSDISLNNMLSGNLSLKLDESSINMNTSSTEKPSLASIDIIARNHSSFTTGEFKVDSMSLVLVNSEANLEIIAKKIHGILSDSSSISARQPEEISMKKDSSSKISVNDY